MTKDEFRARWRLVRTLHGDWLECGHTADEANAARQAWRDRGYRMGQAMEAIFGVNVDGLGPASERALARWAIGHDFEKLADVAEYRRAGDYAMARKVLGDMAWGTRTGHCAPLLPDRRRNPPGEQWLVDTTLNDARYFAACDAALGGPLPGYGYGMERPPERMTDDEQAAVMRRLREAGE